MANDENPQALAGRRILIVEDEMLLAMDLEMFLEDRGCEVLGPASNVAEALAILEAERPDAATVDMNLNGDSSAPVAAALQECGVPFVFVSGYNDKQNDYPAFKDVPFVNKPYDTADLHRQLDRMLA
jgi:CheY-like chemotaxis protein